MFFSTFAISDAYAESFENQVPNLKVRQTYSHIALRQLVKELGSGWSYKRTTCTLIQKRTKTNPRRYWDAGSLYPTYDDRKGEFELRGEIKRSHYRRPKIFRFRYRKKMPETRAIKLDYAVVKARSVCKFVTQNRTNKEYSRALNKTRANHLDYYKWAQLKSLQYEKNYFGDNVGTEPHSRAFYYQGSGVDTCKFGIMTGPSNFRASLSDVTLSSIYFTADYFYFTINCRNNATCIEKRSGSYYKPNAKTKIIKQSTYLWKKGNKNNLVFKKRMMRLYNLCQKNFPYHNFRILIQSK